MNTTEFHAIYSEYHDSDKYPEHHLYCTVQPQQASTTRAPGAPSSKTDPFADLAGLFCKFLEQYVYVTNIQVPVFSLFLWATDCFITVAITTN